jgi:predicted AAA+ superfamily ATPase
MYEDIVNEYLDMPLPTRIDRDDGGLTLPRPAPHNPVWSIVGVRRCGKTNMLYQLMEGLIERGVPRELMLYVDFDDDRLDTDSRTCANDALEAYYELVPEARQGCYRFLDEIQEAQGWQTFVRRVSEHYSVTIVLSGSSSKLLSTDIPTELRGRSFSHTMWPLGFSEYCRFHSVDTSSRSGFSGTHVATGLQRAFGDYLERGGFLRCR